MAQVWRQRERGNPFMMNVMAVLVRWFGRRCARLLLYPIVTYYFLAGPIPRRASYEFLGRVYGRRARWWEVFRHLHTYSATLLDRAFLSGGPRSPLDVRVHNRDVFHRAVGQGGCLLITSHLGSYEVMRALGRDYGRLPIRMLLDRRPGAMVEAAMSQFNPHYATAVIDRSRGGLESVLQIREALARGEMVGLMADRVESHERSVRCDFMGRPAYFPQGPWLLAAMLDVPVILCVGLYRGGNRYDLYLEHLAERIRLERGRREAGAAQWAQRYADRLAEYARGAPDNWFNFYPFWADE